MRQIILCLFLTMGLWLRSISAQETDYTWIGSPSTPADWNEPDNWNSPFGNFVPNGAFDENATIANGGTAVVTTDVTSVLDLDVTRGTVVIDSGGDLDVLRNLNVSSGGLLHLNGSGALKVGGNSSNSVRITGPDAQYDISGNLTSRSVIAEITGNSHSVITVAGAANLGGRLQVEFTGVTPTFGASWPLIAADTVNGAFDQVNLATEQPLPRGLRIQPQVNGGNVAVTVSNSLLLTVDRRTGQVAIENPVAGPIQFNGYSVDSANGLLNSAGWSSLMSSGAAGNDWEEANPTNAHLSELNLVGSTSLDVGNSLPLGSAYTPGPQSIQEEDVIFEYITTAGEVVTGIVEYAGPANDLVLTVDPDTGEGAISNLSSFIVPPEVMGYSIDSASESLTPESWTSFEDTGGAGIGWEEANPTSGHLSELNLTGYTFAQNTLVGLGTIFSPGSSRDVVFEYLTTNNEVLLGTVEYGSIPEVMPSLPGDFNGNGMLDSQDIDLLSEQVRAMTHSAAFDLNDDDLVNDLDRDVWVEDLSDTYYGDANLDGEFNTGDLVAVFMAGQYEDDVVGNSEWATGDWNGDTEFDTGDLVKAFQAGGYELGPRPALNAVPEPAGCGPTLLMVLLTICGARRRRYGEGLRLKAVGPHSAC